MMLKKSLSSNQKYLLSQLSYLSYLLPQATLITCGFTFKTFDIYKDVLTFFHKRFIVLWS